MDKKIRKVILGFKENVRNIKDKIGSGFTGSSFNIFVPSKFANKLVTPDEESRKIMEKGGEESIDRKNRVFIYKRDMDNGETELVRSTNLVTYSGRNWLMQRAFNIPLYVGSETITEPFSLKDSTDNVGSNTDPYDYMNGIQTFKNDSRYISWFALGKGGADIQNSPFQPESVYNYNYNLNSPIYIDYTNTSLPTNNLSRGSLSIPNYYLNPSYTSVRHDFVPFDSTYPKFLVETNIPQEELDEMRKFTFNSIDYIPHSYLNALISVTITTQMYNRSLESETFQFVNEAGLYVSTSHSALDISANSSNVLYHPRLFARTTFSTIRKDDSIEYVINWYVYF